MMNLPDDIEFVNVEFVEKANQAKDTVTFKFRTPKDFSWSEGTHLHLAFVDLLDGQIHSEDDVRTFSIMSLKEGNYLGITTRIKGNLSDFKKRMMELKSGDEMLNINITFQFKIRVNWIGLVTIN